MTREEWHSHIESVPLTDNQLGRIMAEWERLGHAGDSDRAERLTLTAAIAGAGELASTRDLTQGQAGRVIRVLADCDGLDKLRAEYTKAGQADDAEANDVAEHGMTLARALATAFAFFAFPEFRAAIERGWQQAGRHE